MDIPLVVELTPRTWSEVRDLGLASGIPHVFRGQHDAAWGLAPSMERAVERGGVRPSDAADREDWILREFARRSRNYNIVVPENSPLDVLALLQHYGGPTRLLDFTHSLYVAAFFALEFATGPAVIWAVNLVALEGAIAAALDLPNEAGFFRLSHSKYDSIAHDVLTRRREARLVIPVEPFHMHERMSTQQALFMFPCDLSASFEENLAASFGRDVAELGRPKAMDIATFNASPDALELPITRIVLSRRIRREIIEDLWRMNINAATLFPGLDGFARSLHYHVRAVSSVEPWLLEND